MCISSIIHMAVSVNKKYFPRPNRPSAVDRRGSCPRRDHTSHNSHHSHLRLHLFKSEIQPLKSRPSRRPPPPFETQQPITKKPQRGFVTRPRVAPKAFGATLGNADY